MALVSSCSSIFNDFMRYTDVRAGMLDEIATLDESHPGTSGRSEGRLLREARTALSGEDVFAVTV